uniref:CCOAOMT2 n=1 Tax=Arundo donax TaxID=35708 RepID=A0A0A9E8X7_ARUDO
MKELREITAKHPWYATHPSISKLPIPSIWINLA